MAVIIPFPMTFFLKVVTTTPLAAEMIAEAMEEVGNMKKPWYGFNLAARAKPALSGCTVVIRVTNAQGDEEGLRVNSAIMRLRRYLILTENPLPHGRKTQARVLLIA